ncbi:MAG: hypothetical protein WDA27_11185 [Actinomycetota bacterium]
MDPSLGRFLQVDPVASRTGTPYVSAYVYANNRPTVLIDPLGLFPWRSVFQGIAIAAGVVAVVATAGLLAVAAGTVTLSAATVAALEASVGPAALAGVVGAFGVTAMDCLDDDAATPCGDSATQFAVGVGLTVAGYKTLSDATRLAAALAGVAMYPIGPTK